MFYVCFDKGFIKRRKSLMKKKVLTTTIATGLMAAGVLTTQNPASAKADTVPTGDNATSTN